VELNAALSCEFPQREQAPLSPLSQFRPINADQCASPQFPKDDNT
jgi:hypothetical protein